ncbi:MAG: lytic transglycosylase domain-containing protein [Pelagibacteraceae bacterium]|nr:lytic transglycosylase domain-containing protein [Pelagibacteraceae bacterium]
MLYLKNSLVNLTIILFFSFFLTVSIADDGAFIFPKKKIIIIKPVIKNQIDVKKNNVFELSDLPQKKPIETKIIKQKNLTENNKNSKLVEDSNIKKKSFSAELPLKKPTKKKVKKDQTINAPYLETETKKNIQKLKKKPTLKEVKQEAKPKSVFIYPSKKPLNYSNVSTKVESKSKILKEKDYIKAKNIFNLIKKGKWITALERTKKVKDKEFKNLVTWLYLKERGNQATFNDYKNFIKENSDYPRIGRLRYMAEHKIILDNTSPRTIINWFSENEPLSGTGKIKLGEAYLKVNENELGTNLIKSGWINADLSSRDVKYYRNKFKKILTTKEHLKRVDYLAWNNKYWDLKRMLRYLPKKEKLLYNARFILMTNSYGVDKAISDVPQELKNDLGLQYNRLKWRARRNRLESSLEILRMFHGEETLIYPQLWWKLRENITRDLIYAKKYSLAYEVSSNHHLKEGPEFADAEWISGWLALSFLNNNELAINHFKNFYSNVGYPISLARGAFWLGLAYEKSNNQDKARKFYKESSRFTNTYYGQLSFNKIYSGQDFKLSSEFKVTNGYEKEFNSNKLIRHIKLLKEMDKTKFSKDILKHLASLNVERGSEILAAKLSSEIGRYDYAIQIAKQASYEKRFINTYNYPIISVPEEINGKQMPSQELVLAIIRQESEFDARANSYVGAQGLMQLMPATARLVAKKLRITYNKSSLKTDPSYNIKLGTYYFNSLLEDYDGVFPFAVGAYNAGPNRIKSWVRRYGDPNIDEISFIDWVELIRFKETRNYVQRVIENINVYKYILNKDSIKIDVFFRK